MRRSYTISRSIRISIVVGFILIAATAYTGYIRGVRDGKQIIGDEKQSVSPPPSPPTLGEISDVTTILDSNATFDDLNNVAIATHTSRMFQIRFEYPPDIFQVVETSNKIQLVDYRGACVEIERIPSDLGVLEWWQSISSHYIPFIPKSATFQNEKAYYFRHAGFMENPMDMIVVKKRSVILIVSFSVPPTLGVDAGYTDTYYIDTWANEFKRTKSGIVSSILHSIRFD